MPELRKRRRHHFFCLNDSSFPEVSAAERAARVIDFLERYFPIPAPWEKVAGGVSPPTLAVPSTSAPSEGA